MYFTASGIYIHGVVVVFDCGIGYITAFNCGSISAIDINTR